MNGDQDMSRFEEARIDPMAVWVARADRLRQAAPGLRTPRRFARFRRVRSAAWRWWRGENGLRALAELDDDQLSNLSETGQQLRREARRARAR
jgi:uncharacterized protein YjiS (DUF1127 family)